MNKEFLKVNSIKVEVVQIDDVEVLNILGDLTTENREQLFESISEDVYVSLAYSEDDRLKELNHYGMNKKGELVNFNTGLVLKPVKCLYYKYCLTAKGEGKSKKQNQRMVYQHRILATIFKNGYAEGKVVNHIDECKLNNDLSNLEIVTHKENINHGTALERRQLTNNLKKLIKAIEEIGDGDTDDLLLV